MRGRLAGGPEVVGGANQTLTKVPLPDPVHHDPAGERMVRPGQPLGQLLAAAAPGNDRLPVSRKHDGELLRNRVSEAPGIAAEQHSLIHSLAFRHGTGHGRRRRRSLLQILDLLPEGRQAGYHRRRQERVPLFIRESKGTPDRRLPEWSVAMVGDFGEESGLVVLPAEHRLGSLE